MNFLTQFAMQYNKNNNYKILITGSSGFIGRNLVEQLENRYKIYAPLSKDLNLLDKNSVIAFLKNNKVDVIIHTALYVGLDKTKFVQDILKKNLLMFFNLIDNRKYYKKMIIFGSGAEYNKANPIVDVDETDFGKSIPEDDYGVLKYVISKYIENTDNIINLRLFGVYGKYEDYTRRFISNAICQSIMGFSITIKQNVFFDYLFIDDLTKIVEFFINNKVEYKFYNVGRGEKIDLVTLAKIIKKVTNNKNKIEILKDGFANEYTCRNKRLLKELNEFQFISFKDSIESMTNWYLSKKSTIDIKKLI